MENPTISDSPSSLSIFASAPPSLLAASSSSQPLHSDHPTAHLIRSSQSTAAPTRSILGSILSTNNTSPKIPETSTEHWSRLHSPPRELHNLSSSKSDSESHTSASLSPGASGEEHSSGSSAIIKALNAPMDGKRVGFLFRTCIFYKGRL